MARLHVMITYCLCIILHVIDCQGSCVDTVLTYKVTVIASGLALEDVTIVKEKHVFPVLLSHVLHVSAHACQRASYGLVFNEVVREEVSVDIAGCQHLYCDILFFCHNMCSEAQHSHC